jgi:hypothetical protein
LGKNIGARKIKYQSVGKSDGVFVGKILAFFKKFLILYTQHTPTGFFTSMMDNFLKNRPQPMFPRYFNGIQVVCLWVIVLILASCGGNLLPSKKKTTSPQTTNSKGPAFKSYDEDLTVYRPKYNSASESSATASGTTSKKKKEVPPPMPKPTDAPLHINRRLDMVLDTIAQRNKYVRYANGFRIQLYVGNDRKSADDAKGYIYNTYPELNPYMSFVAPRYMIRVGDFMTRLDAERYQALLREVYPSSLVVSDKVDIKKAILVR